MTHLYNFAVASCALVMGSFVACLIGLLTAKYSYGPIHLSTEASRVVAAAMFVGSFAGTAFGIIVGVFLKDD